MIKMLLAENDGNFTGLDRVNQSPAGFLAIENDDDEIQMPDHGFDAAFPHITPTDVRNAFVIRDFDLRLPARKQDFGNAQYFREVTDRITGAETQRIEAIRDELADIGYLTNNTCDARLVNRQPLKLKNKSNEADALEDRMRDYLDECQDTGILQNFRRKRDLEIEREEVEQEITVLEKAERQATLERGRKLLDQLEKTREQLQEHEDREQNEIQEYQKLQNRIAAYREQRKEADVRPGFYRNGLYVSTGLFALSLLVAIVSPLPGLNILAGVLFLATAGFGYKHWDMRKLEKKEQDLVDDANHIGIQQDTLPEVNQALEDAIESFNQRDQELNRKESRIVGQLQELFDGDGETVDYWEDILETFADTVEEVDTEFDEDRLHQLEGRRSEIDRELDELDDTLQSHTNQIAEFDSDVAALPLDHFLDVDEVRVESVADLEKTADYLEQFVSRINRHVDTATSAIEIFEEIEEAEERDINHVFDDDSYAVRFFNDATDGNYTDVRYDEANNVVRVTRADGRELTPDKLSQGTYDLLYMAIRLKLAQDLLGDRPGFLILDDAFLHSDSDRITEEIEILNELANDGWQIIYFSIRDAVREAVEHTSNGQITQLPQLEFDS